MSFVIRSFAFLLCNLTSFFQNLPVDDIAKSSSNFSLMNSNELEKSLSETIASSGEPKSNAGDTMSSEHQTIPQREIFMSDENDEERKNKGIFQTNYDRNLASQF